MFEDVRQAPGHRNHNHSRDRIFVLPLQGHRKSEVGHPLQHHGADCQEWKGHVTGRHHACQGNILAGEGVVTGMSAAFRKTKGPLADRLLAALEAGQAKGGDKRGRQSAALLVVRKDGGYAGFNDRYIDLRVDDHPRPIEELRRVYGKWKMIFGRADGGPWQWLRMARR